MASGNQKIVIIATKRMVDMVSKTQKRDIIIFSYGILLGIMGNLIVENLMAYLYPEGIPKDQAFIGIIVWVVIVVVFAAFCVHVIHTSD